MPNTRSKGAPLLPYGPKVQRTLRKMVNAQELEAQKHRMGLEVDIDTARNLHQTSGINQPSPGVQQNARINQSSVVDENKGVEGVRYSHSVTFTTPGVKFTITNTMIQLLKPERHAEVGELGYTFELSAEQRKREEERVQDMAHMMTQIDLLTKHIVAKSEKVNVGGQPNMYEDQDLDLDEKANYLGNQEGRNYARDGQYKRPSNRDQGNWKNTDGYRNDSGGVYVPQAIDIGQVVVPADLSWKI
ncbi:hypothetical protein KY284_035856 [Solanum tuberosum]|nr:hypothetical protein KY284_035856 [Solanum tuberosum]